MKSLIYFWNIMTGFFLSLFNNNLPPAQVPEFIWWGKGKDVKRNGWELLLRYYCSIC